MLRRALLALLLLVPSFAGAQSKSSVLLISFDGFRSDYAERYEARNLIAMGKRGVTAKAMLPSFPSTTFPNHYTIVTGMYPAHHGIVENSFWDPKIQARFQFSDAKVAYDTRFWGGTPLWVLAEKQGLKAACYFWPGSDYEIQGTRPTYWYNYDGKVTNQTKADQIIAWLQLPEDKRPRFMTMYLADVDHEGHAYGPDAAETRKSVQDVDQVLGDLLARIDKTGVPVDVIVVSDHGMIKVEGNIDLGKFTSFEGLRTVGGGNDFKIYSDGTPEANAKLDKVYADLKKAEDGRFGVYRQSEIPKELHYTGNARIGDVVVLALKPIALTVTDPNRPPRQGANGGPRSTHGFDVARVPEMKAIFYAAGPDFKQGITIDEFENINVYPLIARILGLKITHKIDGDLKVLAPILK